MPQLSEYFYRIFNIIFMLTYIQAFFFMSGKVESGKKNFAKQAVESRYLVETLRRLSYLPHGWSNTDAKQDSGATDVYVQ